MAKKERKISLKAWLIITIIALIVVEGALIVRNMMGVRDYKLMFVIIFVVLVIGLSLIIWLRMLIKKERFKKQMEERSKTIQSDWSSYRELMGGTKPDANQDKKD